jgi:hypothetical protein
MSRVPSYTHTTHPKDGSHPIKSRPINQSIPFPLSLPSPGPVERLDHRRRVLMASQRRDSDLFSRYGKRSRVTHPHPHPHPLLVACRSGLVGQRRCCVCWRWRHPRVDHLETRPSQSGQVKKVKGGCQEDKRGEIERVKRHTHTHRSRGDERRRAKSRADPRVASLHYTIFFTFYHIVHRHSL